MFFEELRASLARNLDGKLECFYMWKLIEFDFHFSGNPEVEWERGI